MASDGARDAALLIERTVLLNARAPVGEMMAMMMAVSGVGSTIVNDRGKGVVRILHVEVYFARKQDLLPFNDSTRWWSYQVVNVVVGGTFISTSDVS